MISLFLRQLKRLDRTLSLELDREIQRYVVYRRDRQNLPRQILVIEDSGEFCYPNYEHIVKLYKMDSWRNKNLIAEMDAHNASLDKDSDEKMHYLSNELSKLATRSSYY